jgi:hypothetical protein
MVPSPYLASIPRLSAGHLRALGNEENGVRLRPLVEREIESRLGEIKAAVRAARAEWERSSGLRVAVEPPHVF